MWSPGAASTVTASPSRVPDHVGRRRRAHALLQRDQRVGHRLGVQDRAQDDVVRDPGLAAIGAAHQRVRAQPEAGRVHARLGQQAGLDDGDEVGRTVLARLEQDAGVDRVQQPVPVLPHQRAAVGGRLGQRRERAALGRQRRAVAGVAALAANSTSVRVLIARTSANSTPAPSAMPRISSRYCGHTRLDRRDVAQGVLADRRPVPAGVVREHPS